MQSLEQASKHRKSIVSESDFTQHRMTATENAQIINSWQHGDISITDFPPTSFGLIP